VEKITTRQCEGVGVKNEESRQTFNKNLCDLLEAIIIIINNLRRKQTYESKMVDVSLM